MGLEESEQTEQGWEDDEFEPGLAEAKVPGGGDQQEERSSRDRCFLSLKEKVWEDSFLSGLEVSDTHVGGQLRCKSSTAKTNWVL